MPFNLTVKKTVVYGMIGNAISKKWTGRGPKHRNECV